MEQELHRVKNVLVRGTFNSKIGTAVLTDERLLFFDERFSSAGGGGGIEGEITGWLVDRLQQRHEAKGPLLELPVQEISRIARETKLMNKDRIRIFAADGQEYLFNEGWRVWSHYLVEVMRVRYGRTPVAVSADEWRFEEPART